MTKRTGNTADQNRLNAVAEHSLHHFDETAMSVRAELGERRPTTENVFASLNTVTAEHAVANLNNLSETQQRELRNLCAEPAVARIVTEDDEGVHRIYFISRATPHRSPSDGSLAVSYRANPLGRLAAQPVGTEVEALIGGDPRTLTVVERTLLRPKEVGGKWDSLNSVVEGRAFGPFTISSFRDLLQKADIPADEIDALEAALADDRAAAVVVEGLKRDAIIKAELRDLAVLDQYQDEIFRLPIDTRLVILGPPGTGKTTTLIKRLGLKLDQPNLSDDERDIVTQTIAGSVRHQISWVMFTPANLLKQYIKEAFNHENIPAPDERIQTWDDFRRDLARNHFGILRSGVGSGQFIMKENLTSLRSDTIATQRDWYDDFETWQQNFFWDELRSHAQTLASDKSQDVARLGERLVAALPLPTLGLHVGVFPALAGLSQSVQTLLASLKDGTDKDIRSAIALEFREDSTFLNALTDFVGTLTDTEESEDVDADDDDDARQVRVGREAAVEALSRALRAKARSVASGRAMSRQTRNGRLIEWFGDRGPPQGKLRTLGVSLQVQASARRFLNPVRRLIDGLPSRYRRFRRERHAESLWYSVDGFAASDIHPLEVDVVLLAILRIAQALRSDRRIARDMAQGGYTALAPMESLYRTQILVDEATDFSPVQLACMAGLCDPAIQSFVACGDFNQRITEWGSRSNADLNWVFPDFDVRSISITYRHSRQLNELARAIAVLSSPDVPEAQLPQRVNNEGFEPVLAKGLTAHSEIAGWLALRIAEIERLSETLPPIAVLVCQEDEVEPLSKALNDVLADGNIRAIPCRDGQLAGQDNDVRVFDVRHIKGLEFEAVFFVGIDRLAESQPDLFEKFLYVGATRAAMYLGITTSSGGFPERVASLEGRFKQRWP